MKPLYCACCDTPLMSAATAFVCPTCGAVYRQHGTRFAFAAELTAEMESITDSIKRHMDAEGVDTLNGTDWKVTYKAVTSSRLDTTALKKALPDLTAQFTKTTTARRFCIA